MSWPEEKIADAFRNNLEPGARTESCAPPEAIWDAVNLALPASERTTLIGHMAQCPHCAFVWQAAVAVRDPQQRSAPSMHEAPATGVLGNWTFLLKPRWLAPAAGALAFALVTMVWLNVDSLSPLPPPTSDGVLRGTAPTPSQTAVSLELAPGQVISWSPVAGASAHKLVLFNPDSKAVELFPDRPGQYQLEPELAGIFTPGEQVYWYVEALDGNRPGARSGTAAFIFSAAADG